jgi:hypothetical protein
VDEADDEPTIKRQRPRRDGIARPPPYAGPPPGVPIDLALRRYGPPKLVAELARLEAEARLKCASVFSSAYWEPVSECRERLWHELCKEVEQDRFCISHLPSKATGARRVFPSDRCWYLKLPRIIRFDEGSAFMRLLFHNPGPDVLDYLGQELRDVLIHQAPALEVATHIWLIGQRAPPTVRSAYAWAKPQGYSQTAVWKIVTAVFGPRSAGRRPKSP